MLSVIMAIIRNMSIHFVRALALMFTILMVAAYTASLAANLSAGKKVQPLSAVEDLLKRPDIEFGFVNGGATSNFFKVIPHQKPSSPTFNSQGGKMSLQKSKLPVISKLWKAVSSDGSNLVERNQDGAKKVRQEKGKYAFFLEQGSADHNVRENCDLMQVGKPLNERNYGLGLSKGGHFQHTH